MTLGRSGHAESGNGTSVPGPAVHSAATIWHMGAREAVNWEVVGLSGLPALLYLLIGANVVSLGEITREEQRAVGLPATAVFAGGAIVAATWHERWLWIVGAVGLAAIIVMYFSLASQREPPYEMWGIMIRVAQRPLLAGLVYLAITSPIVGVP